MTLTRTRYVAILLDESDGANYVALDVADATDESGDFSPEQTARAAWDATLRIAAGRHVVDVVRPDELMALLAACDEGAPDYLA